MSERFEVGDEVECVETGGNAGITVGKTYVVISADSTHITVGASDRGRPEVYRASRFKRRPAPAETREVVRYLQDAHFWEWDGKTMRYWSGSVWSNEPSVASHEMCESWAKSGIVTRTVIRPAPAPAPVLPRQPHEPETVALMRPEELRQFRAGQERREREAAARLTNALHAHDMVQREGSLKSTVDPQTLAAYRALCVEGKR